MAILTTHALERYAERVSRSVETTNEKDAQKWTHMALKHGKKIGTTTTTNGHKADLISYKGYTLVFSRKENKIITINSYLPALNEDTGYHNIKNEVGELVSKKLSKNIKLLNRQYRETKIKLHEEEIKRLKVHNPNTQDIISRRVLHLQKNLEEIESKIEGIRLVGEQYGVEV